MIKLISGLWRIFLLRGAVAIVFGLSALLWPRLEVDLPVIVFGIFVAAETVLALVISFSRFAEKNYSFMAEAIIGLVIAVLTFLGPGLGLGRLLDPAMTAITLLFFVASWILLAGVCQLIESIQLRKDMRGELSLLGSGLLSVICAIILVSRWDRGAIAMSWVIGVCLILYGILHVLMTVRVRKSALPA